MSTEVAWGVEFDAVNSHNNNKYCPSFEWRSEIKMTSSQQTIKHTNIRSTHAYMRADHNVYNKTQFKNQKKSFQFRMWSTARIELRACLPETIRRHTHTHTQIFHTQSHIFRYTYGSGFYLCRKRWLYVFILCEISWSSIKKAKMNHTARAVRCTRWGKHYHENGDVIVMHVFFDFSAWVNVR